jgi:hypothetical protein
VSRRWAGVLFAALGVLLLPWALWLGYTLPERKIAHHWDLAWSGFDVVLSLALVGTAFALLTDRPVGRSFAAASGALLLADACSKSSPRKQDVTRWLAVLLAALGRFRSRSSVSLWPGRADDVRIGT